MAACPKTFTDADFTLQSDGHYEASLPVTTHGLGVNFHVTKNIKRDDSDI